MSKAIMFPLAELVFDGTLYPRHTIDQSNVASLMASIAAGNKLPPLIACEKSKRIIDGVHRHKAFIQELGSKTKQLVDFRQYKSDAAALAESIALNASHGKRLEKYDWAHCVAIAERVGLKTDGLISALQVTRPVFDKATRDRVVTAERNMPFHQPLKRSFRHMSGEMLTEKQFEVNKRSSGWPAVFHATQLIDMIEADLLPRDERTLDTMKKLSALLAKMKL